MSGSEPLRNAVTKYGWVSTSIKDDDQGFLQLAQSFGHPVPPLQGKPLISRLSPVPSSKARPGTMSSMFGVGGFPMHTDTAHWPTPARYILLRSTGIRSPRPTLLVEHGFLNLDDKTQAATRHGIWLVRGPHGPFFCSMTFDANGSRGFRYDSCCMVPQNRSAHYAQQNVQQALSRLNPITISWKPNLAIIIDNWRMLHARGEAPNTDDSERVIERILVVQKNGGNS